MRGRTVPTVAFPRASGSTAVAFGGPPGRSAGLASPVGTKDRPGGPSAVARAAVRRTLPYSRGRIGRACGSPIIHAPCLPRGLGITAGCRTVQGRGARASVTRSASDRTALDHPDAPARPALAAGVRPTRIDRVPAASCTFHIPSDACRGSRLNRNGPRRGRWSPCAIDNASPQHHAARKLSRRPRCRRPHHDVHRAARMSRIGRVRRLTEQRRLPRCSTWFP